jgi:hypothetical protein
VRTELIDLMARILVTVFEAQGGKVDESSLVQSQNQAGAPGAQSDRLLAPIQRETSAAEQGEPASYAGLHGQIIIRGTNVILREFLSEQGTDQEMIPASVRLRSKELCLSQS